MTEQIPEQPRGLEPGPIESGQARPVPPEIGSNRFPWKSLLLMLGLSVVGAGVGYLVGERLFPGLTASLGVKSMVESAVAVTGFGVGIFLTSHLNIFRENVVDLRGNGKLHPKSPAALPRS